MTNSMAKVFLSGLMVLSTRGYLIRVKKMVKVSKFGMMAVDMKETLRMTCFLVKDI